MLDNFFNSIDLDIFLKSLDVMLWGMVGIFIVLIIIYLSIKALMKLFPGDEA